MMRMLLGRAAHPTGRSCASLSVLFLCVGEKRGNAAADVGAKLRYRSWGLIFSESWGSTTVITGSIL